MKKIALILILIAIAVMFTACDGSKDNYHQDMTINPVYYTHAYINVGGDFVNVEISRWAFFSTRDVVQLELKDGTILVVDAENCILYKGTLPTTMSAFEQRVLETACRYLDADTQGASIELVSREFVAWLDCYTYNYIVTLADGTRWLVGARENADGFYCDVECEING